MKGKRRKVEGVRYKATPYPLYPIPYTLHLTPYPSPLTTYHHDHNHISLKTYLQCPQGNQRYFFSMRYRHVELGANGSVC